MEDRLVHILSIGKKHSANEWAIILNTTKSAVYSYFKHYKRQIGHLIDQRTPCRSEPIRELIEKEGKEHTANDWASILNFKVSDIRNAVAKYPHLKPYIIRQKNRTVFRLPREWGIEIETSEEKRTMRQWSEHLGCDIDVLRSYVGQRKYLRQYIQLISSDKIKHIVDQLLLVKDELPMKRVALCERIGVSIGTFDHYLDEIFECTGLTMDQILKKPIKAEILKTISESEEMLTMTEWANFFDVDLSYISKLTHNNNLLLKVKPTINMPVYRAFQKSLMELES